VTVEGAVKEVIPSLANRCIIGSNNTSMDQLLLLRGQNSESELQIGIRNPRTPHTDHNADIPFDLFKDGSKVGTIKVQFFSADTPPSNNPLLK
jgi:hypothetical protein